MEKKTRNTERVKYLREQLKRGDISIFTRVVFMVELLVLYDELHSS